MRAGYAIAKPRDILGLVYLAIASATASQYRRQLMSAGMLQGRDLLLLVRRGPVFMGIHAP